MNQKELNDQHEKVLIFLNFIIYLKVKGDIQANLKENRLPN